MGEKKRPALAGTPAERFEEVVSEDTNQLCQFLRPHPLQRAGSCELTRLPYLKELQGQVTPSDKVGVQDLTQLYKFLLTARSDRIILD